MNSSENGGNPSSPENISNESEVVNDKRSIATQIESLDEELTNTVTTQTFISNSFIPCEAMEKQLDRLKEISDLIFRSVKAAEQVVENTMKLEIARSNNNNRSENRLLSSTLVETSPLVANDLMSNSSSSNNAENCSLNSTLMSLQRTIEKGNVYRGDINRDYKLNNNTKFSLWDDFFISEVKNYDLYDVIEPSERSTSTSDAEFRDIIINRINKFYHNQIAHMSDSKEIIQHLKEFKRIEFNISNSSIRSRLHEITMKPNEKASDFINRFETILRDNYNCENGVPFTEEEIGPAFYKAIIKMKPRIEDIAIVFKNANNNKEMTYKQLKNSLLDME